MYLDSENWLKASIEYENERFQRLGSVVTKGVKPADMGILVGKRVVQGFGILPVKHDHRNAGRLSSGKRDFASGGKWREYAYPFDILPKSC